MLCGFRDLVMHIIAEHPEQVNDRSGLNHSPLVAALYKRHFDVAELLHQHGTAWISTASLIELHYKLRRETDSLMLHSGYSPMGHGSDADALDGGHWTPFMNAAANGHWRLFGRY